MNSQAAKQGSDKQLENFELVPDVIVKGVTFERRQHHFEFAGKLPPKIVYFFDMQQGGGGRR